MPKTNCGQAIEVDCIDCFKKIQNWCFKCTNKELRLELHKLKSELAYLKNEYDGQFEIEPYKINKHIRVHAEPQPYVIDTSSYFFTITFDPSRFKGLGLNHQKEERYIKHQLARLCESELIYRLYGSFELTNSGITHAHVIINTYQPIEVWQKLKREFTFDPNNNIAVMKGSKKDRTGKANANALAYINKLEEGKGTENKTWYSKKEIQEIEDDNGLDYYPQDNIITA